MKSKVSQTDKPYNLYNLLPGESFHVGHWQTNAVTLINQFTIGENPLSVRENLFLEGGELHV